MTYRLRILLAVLLGTALKLEAQTPAFSWATAQEVDMTGAAFSQPWLSLVAADDAGGATTAGMHQWVDTYSGQYYGSLQLRHYLADATEDWVMHYSGNAQVLQLQYAPNGDIFMLGRYLDSLRLGPQHYLSAPAQSPHYFLACLDNWGGPLWTIDMHQAFGITQDAAGLDLDAQGNVYFASRTGSTVSIRKYSGTGQPLTIIPQTATTLSSLDVDPLGNVYATGSCVSNAQGAMFGGVHFSPNVSGNGYNRYLVRYRVDGTPAWVRFSGDFSCPESEVRCDGSTHVYWAGELIGNTTFGSFPVNGPANGSTPDFHLARLDSSGNYLWVEEVPTGQNMGAGTGHNHYLEVDAAGNATIAGVLRGSVTWNNGTQISSTGYFDPMAVQYNQAGTVNWAKVANNTYGQDQGFSLSTSPDGAVYLTGSTKGTLTFDTLSISHPTGSATMGYSWVARLDGAAVMSVSDVASAPGISLYPNPTAESITLELKQPVQQIQLLDALGRLCYKAVKFTGTSLQLPLQGLAAGAYVVRVLDGQGSYSLPFYKTE